jgi:cell division protein ZipA
LAVASRTARDDDDFNPELPGKVRVVKRPPRIAAESPAAPATPTLVEPAPEAPRVEQVDMFGDLEIPAGQPAAAREIRERGELPRREAQGSRTATGKHSAVANSSSSSNNNAGKPASAEKPAKKAGPEEVIVVHVMSGDARLDGKNLLQAALDCGLRFGEYNIFHRYESAAHDASAMFSMANAVEPGVFDLDAMETQSYVGVSFFLMLPGPANSRQALDLMIEAARRVAAAVSGDLHDQQHSVLTAQTVEHLRQRVMEYERRKLAQQLANG